MADITWAHVTDHAAELATVDVDAQTDILAYVNSSLVSAEFGGEDSSTYKLARIYLAAHTATLGPVSGGAGAAGPVTAEAAGGLSRSYGFIASMTIAGYDSTSYGRLFAQLVRRSPARAGRVL